MLSIGKATPTPIMISDAIFLWSSSSLSIISNTAKASVLDIDYEYHQLLNDLPNKTNFALERSQKSQIEQHKDVYKGN